MHKLLLLLTISSFSLLADDTFMEINSTQNEVSTIKQSKWLVDIGTRYIGYKAEFAAFKGEHADIESEETMTTYSFNLGVGREFYLGSNLSVSIKGSGFYSNNSNEEVGNAAEELEYVLSTFKEQYEINGQELSASINYLFENRAIHIQPFFEFGVGRGTTKVSKELNDKGIPATPTPSTDDYPPETYTYKSSEDFIFTRLTIGVNFLSNYNINSYLKVSQNSVNVSNRDITKAEATRDSSAVAIALPSDSATYSSTSVDLGVTVTF